MLDETRNILDAWGQCSDQDILDGHAWYPSANMLAQVVGKGNVVMGAGIIAALSPNKSWDQNVRLAMDARNGDVHGHVTDALDKCRAIMAGCDPAEVLPKGKKTWFFFHNIVFPSDSRYVTVDRHAYRVAKSDWNNGSPVVKPREYVSCMAGFQEAALILRLPAPVVQAGTWGWARRVH